MQFLSSNFTEKWRKSVVFRLSVLMVIIVAFATISQTSIGFQVLKLRATQESFQKNSVPLLEKSQEFARLMTTTLSQTSQLDETLPTPELEALNTRFAANTTSVNAVLTEIGALLPSDEKSEDFRINLARFSDVSNQLFVNQLTHRDLENRRNAKAQEILQLTREFNDILEQLLTTSTTAILSSSTTFGQGPAPDASSLQLFLNFAAQTETLNALGSHVSEIENIAQSATREDQVATGSTFEGKLRFRIKSIAQSLTQLNDTPERAQLAQAAQAINKSVNTEGGYLDLVTQLAASRQGFSALKQKQLLSVGSLNRDVERIVALASASFRKDIQYANRLTRVIVWIGVLSTILVLLSVFWINRHLIRKQISNRFVALTQDVLAISEGKYDHQVRVSGDDEFGDIARALDVFKKQAAELERSNQELQRFAYVAAHDLRSPLDAIQDLAKWTLEDAHAELGDSSRNNLKLLIKRSARLSALQADLLTYAQASSVSNGVASFALKSEIEKIADLVDPHGRFQIELVNDPGMITCHGTPVRQILINLLTNAIKHHDHSAGKITVLFSHSDARLKFEIRDDGPGIDPRFQVKIFELFQTLKSRDEVEGSGLGLALVKKLTDRFGGTVSVQSAAPLIRGTTFTFEVPDMSVEQTFYQAA